MIKKGGSGRSTAAKKAWDDASWVKDTMDEMAAKFSEYTGHEVSGLELFAAIVSLVVATGVLIYFADEIPFGVIGQGSMAFRSPLRSWNFGL